MCNHFFEIPPIADCGEISDLTSLNRHHASPSSSFQILLFKPSSIQYLLKITVQNQTNSAKTPIPKPIILMEKSTSSACPFCVYHHRKCHQNCWGLEAFQNIISREDYHIIFTIFGPRNLAKVLKDVPEPQYTEILQSYLSEARERTKNPLGGCDARMVSLEKKVEEIYWRVAALETRLDGWSSSADLQSRLTALEARLDERPFGVKPPSPSVSHEVFSELLKSNAALQSNWCCCSKS